MTRPDSVAVAACGRGAAGWLGLLRGDPNERHGELRLLGRLLHYFRVKRYRCHYADQQPRASIGVLDHL
jgi:hypothetical protein